MKKWIRRAAALLLCTAFFSPVPARAAGETVLRVALNYGSAAVSSASLKNSQNTGFRLGYYDENRAFCALAETAETQISVVNTETTMYLTSSGTYTTSSSGARGSIGCYHVELPGAYSDFASAQAATAAVEGGFVAWIDGEYFARAGAYATGNEARDAMAALGIEGCRVLGTSAYSVNVVSTGTTRILFQFDGKRSGETFALGIQPGLEEGVKAVTEYAVGSTKATYYGGFRFERISGGSITVVNMVGLEDYAKGVIPYEMSNSWPIEALKAQAVAAKSYALTLGTKHSGSHADLCTTTDCQVYRGTQRAGENSDRAVDETAGELVYYNGRIANTVYFSSDGGATEDSKNVWGTDHAYLKGVVDPYEADVADRISNYYWTKSFTAQELKDLLHQGGYLCGDIVNFCISQTSAAGNAVAVTFTDSTGKNYTFSRANMKKILGGLRSIHFTLSVSGGNGSGGSGYSIAGSAQTVPDLSGKFAISGDGTVGSIPSEAYAITGEGVAPLEPSAGGSAAGAGAVYTLNGSGWGHNVGMSQWGAYAMAKRGFGYQDILKFYYTGVTIE